MTIISSITTFFSHSNHGKYQLRKEMQKEEDKRGIVAGGATRFSTFATHTRSIIRCFSAMERCLLAGTIKFDTKAVRECTEFTTVTYTYCRRNHCESILYVAHSHSSSKTNLNILIYCFGQLHEGLRHLKDRTQPAPMFF